MKKKWIIGGRWSLRTNMLAPSVNELATNLRSAVSFSGTSILFVSSVFITIFFWNSYCQNLFRVDFLTDCGCTRKITARFYYGEHLPHFEWSSSSSRRKNEWEEEEGGVGEEVEGLDNDDDEGDTQKTKRKKEEKAERKEAAFLRWQRQMARRNEMRANDRQLFDYLLWCLDSSSFAFYSGFFCVLSHHQCPLLFHLKKKSRWPIKIAKGGVHCHQPIVVPFPQV